MPSVATGMVHQIGDLQWHWPTGARFAATLHGLLLTLVYSDSNAESSRINGT